MKKSSKKLVIIIISILAVLVLAFGTLNVFWFVYHSRFLDCRSKLEQQEVAGEIEYKLERNGYSYHVAVPSYLDFGGNLSIYKINENPDPNVLSTDNSGITLLIWLKLFGENELGLNIQPTDEHPNGGQFYIDKSGNPIFQEADSEEYKAVVQQVISENKSDIDGLLQAMQDVWG